MVAAAWGAAFTRTGLASHPQIELSAIADVTPPNLERVGNEQGIPPARRFADASELVALPDLDLVVVATPPWLRKAPVLAALNAGKHVLAEKPLAAVPQDAWEMVEAAKSADRALAMMHNYLFFPEFEAAKAAIDGGAIGEIRTLSANLLCVPDNPGAATFQPGWRRDLGRAGGGILMDMLHPLYVMSWLASAPVSEVSAMIRRTGEGPLPVDDLAMCHLRLDEVYASVNYLLGAGSGRNRRRWDRGAAMDPLHQQRHDPIRQVPLGLPFRRIHDPSAGGGRVYRQRRFGSCERGRATGLGLCRLQHAELLPQPGERRRPRPSPRGVSRGARVRTGRGP